MKTLLTVLVAGFFLASCQSTSETPKDTMTNKEKAVAVLVSLETGATEPVSYINAERYTQHNLAVEDGLEGFGKVLQNKPPGGFKANVVRAFEDGDYVFLHTEYDFFGPKVGFDIFKFEDGLIVEHWDNLQGKAESTASGRSQTDGPTEATDLDKTAENKALIQNLIDDVFMGANPSKITDYISTETYHQHNPAVGDGLAALGTALEEMAKAGTPMEYHKTHMILGEGNFVLSVSEGIFLGNKVAYYDLFRIDNGKVVEHWDTIEQIPPRSEWQNDNGKFGF